MIYIDFETRSKCDLKKAGAWAYSQHPSTEVLCMAYAVDDGEVELWTPEDVPPPLLEGHLHEAHNAFFELAIWTNILKWPAVEWSCSAAKCAAHSLPRALDKAGAALGLDVQKDQEGKRVMMKLCRPRKPSKNNPAVWHEDPEEFNILYEYCKDDVRAERALSHALRDLNKKETKVWQLDQDINRRGIRVDVEAVDAAIEISEEHVKSANSQLEIITEGAVSKVSEAAKLTVWVQEQGVGVSSVTKQEVKDTLAMEIPDRVRKALTIRQKMGKTSVAKYKAIKNALSTDGRLRDLLMYHGAGTGRWTGKLVQPQNFPRNGFKGDIEEYFSILKMKDHDAFELCYPDVMGTVSSMIRPCLIPTEGKYFYGADYSSIEARVLLWLADDENGLGVFARGEDIYKDMASDIYGVPINKVDSNQRQLGKQAILGLGYQMGANKFEQTCLGYGIAIDAEMAERVVEAYRQKYHLVRSMWYDQEHIAKEAITTGKFLTCGKIGWGTKGDFLYCKLPSKRLIAYYDPKIETVKTPWGGEKEGITYMATNPVTRKWERTKTYGGKLVENITQGTARDVMVEAMLRLEDARYEAVLTIHDEIITEKEQGDVAEFETLMSTLPDWAEGLPVAVEGWKGLRYLK